MPIAACATSIEIFSTMRECLAHRKRSSRGMCCLPSAMTWILSSLHTSVGFALVGAVVGEYIAAAQGLGWIISQAQGNFDAAGVYAGMLILCVVVVDCGIRRDLARTPADPMEGHR